MEVFELEMFSRWLSDSDPDAITLLRIVSSSPYGGISAAEFLASTLHKGGECRLVLPTAGSNIGRDINVRILLKTLSPCTV
jgi:hypothetical protein